MFKYYQKINDEPMSGDPIFGPINNEELRGEYMKKELEAVNLIKEKQRENIKGITCANGS